MVDIAYHPHPTAASPSQAVASALWQPDDPQLSLRVACAKGTETSFVAHQYATYPFRLSSNLRLDPTNPERVYAYIMNAGPGILAGDNLRMSVEVSDRASLYLTDQSATKVHSKPVHSKPTAALSAQMTAQMTTQMTAQMTAQMTCALTVGSQAYLEYVPEPIIFFPAAALNQKMQISLHPQGRLVLSEIIVPGRLARAEFYAFEQFENRLQVSSPDGTLLFADTLKLLGQSNRFRDDSLLTDYPILGSFMVIAPELDLNRLSQSLHTIDTPSNALQIGSSPLPNCHGLLVKAMATKTSALRHLQHLFLNTTRQLLNQPSLPEIPK